MDPSNPPAPSPTACVDIDGGKIKQLRESRGLTQLYVATVLEVTTDTISRWENRRSPSIKLENAERLAAVFEVPLAQLLEQPESAAQDSGDRAADSTMRFPAGHLKWFLPTMATAVLLLAAFFFLANKPSENNVVAARLLPKHATPAQPFPVVIRVHSKADLPVSFILQETLPEGCTVLKEEPRAMADPQAKTVKWLSSIEDEVLYFAYLVQTRPADRQPQALRFNGHLKAEPFSQKKQPIAGGDTVELTDYHWADSNKDNKIDDDEILSIYNSFEVLLDLGVDIDTIQNIWAGKGYRWDAASSRYEILP